MMPIPTAAKEPACGACVAAGGTPGGTREALGVTSLSCDLPGAAELGWAAPGATVLGGAAPGTSFAKLYRQQHPYPC